MKQPSLLLALLMLASMTLCAKTPQYQNPIINIDYSDPDVVAAPDGSGYYFTASSFVSTPGLPILYSTDLVNWEIVNYALDTVVPTDHFDGAPQHGNGVWAPSIRYHDGLYYIVWGDPDFGVFKVTATDPRGRWSKPELIIAGRGVIGWPVIVYDGYDKGNYVVEGPKLYKRDGRYYIMAPAGEVEQGWQLAMRADNIYGPYECRTVMSLF